MSTTPQNTHDTEPLRSREDVEMQMKMLHSHFHNLDEAHKTHFFLAITGERYGARGPNGIAPVNLQAQMSGCTQCAMVGLARTLVGALPPQAIMFLLERLSQVFEAAYPMNQVPQGSVQ